MPLEARTSSHPSESCIHCIIEGEGAGEGEGEGESEGGGAGAGAGGGLGAGICTGAGADVGAGAAVDTQDGFYEFRKLLISIPTGQLHASWMKPAQRCRFWLDERDLSWPTCARAGGGEGGGSAH